MQIYRAKMRLLNSRSRLSSAGSSSTPCEPFFPSSNPTKPSSKFTLVEYRDMKEPTPFLIWLLMSSVGTPKDSPSRIRARISSLMRFSKSFHFLPLRNGSPVSYRGFPRTEASRKRLRSCFEEMRIGPAFLLWDSSACQSIVISRNSRESSWSLLVLALCSVRRGFSREWRELRMTWYRLCTCLAVFLVYTNCSSYPRSPYARHVCSCRLAIAFRYMICIPLSAPIVDLPMDFVSDRSLRIADRSLPRDSRCLLCEPERWLSLRQLVESPRKEEKLSSRPIIERLPLKNETSLLHSKVYSCLLGTFQCELM